MARGFHVVGPDEEHDAALLDDEFPEWEPEPEPEPEPSSGGMVRAHSHSPLPVVRTLGNTVSAAESNAMHATSRSGGRRTTSGLTFGMNSVGCDGCRDAPWDDCAACGALAVVALPDPDESVPHSLTLCARCWGVLLDWRECGVSAKHQAAGHKAAGVLRHNPHLAFTAEELARIVALREADLLLWREVAARMGASIEGCRMAYRRLKDRQRWSTSASMVSFSPDERSPRNLSPAVVPRHDKGPRGARSEPPQNLPCEDAQASVTTTTQKKRTQSRLVVPPLLASETATAAAPTASRRKYNTNMQPRVKRAMRRATA